MIPVEEIAPTDRARFDSEVRPRYRPVILRGIASDWPVVAAGRRSAEEALTLVERFDSGAATDIMVAPASEEGRFFYAPDMRGFNFRRQRGTLTQLARELRRQASDAQPAGMYAGAASLAQHLPGFERENGLALAAGGNDAEPRIWMGNATQVATHFDMSDNFAVVALGTRRFTLFPPEATRDLYVGPFNVTPAGQPVSMVDPLAPDLDRYPRYAEAAKLAQFAELEPGDAIYIPTLWWHHVRATAPINLLINYWHNDAARGGGFLALVHALLAIREQPAGQRAAWRHWFDHFVFGEGAGDASAHLPAHAQGVNGPANPQRDEQIRRFLLQVLSDG